MFDLNLGLCYVDLDLCSLVMIYTDVTSSGFSVRQSGLYSQPSPIPKINHQVWPKVEPSMMFAFHPDYVGKPADSHEREKWQRSTTYQGKYSRTAQMAAFTKI